MHHPNYFDFDFAYQQSSLKQVTESLANISSSSYGKKRTEILYLWALFMWAYLVSCLNHLSACLTQFYGSNTLGKIQTAHRFSQVLLHWSNLHNHQGFAVTTYTKQNSRLLSKGLKFYLINVLIYLTRNFF